MIRAAALVSLTAAVIGAQPPDPASLGASIVSRLAAGHFAEVVATFDPKMREALPEDRLRLTWSAIVAQAGHSGQEPGRVQTKGDFRIVLIAAEFERARADVQLVFNAANQLAGFFVRPAAPTTPFVDSPYVDRSTFTEREVTVDAGGWPLSGTLTIRKAPAHGPRSCSSTDQGRAIATRASARPRSSGTWRTGSGRGHCRAAL